MVTVAVTGVTINMLTVALKDVTITETMAAYHLHLTTRTTPVAVADMGSPTVTTVATATMITAVTGTDKAVIIATGVTTAMGQTSPTEIRAVTIRIGAANKAVAIIILTRNQAAAEIIRAVMDNLLTQPTSHPIKIAVATATPIGSPTVAAIISLPVKMAIVEETGEMITAVICRTVCTLAETL